MKINLMGMTVVLLMTVINLCEAETSNESAGPGTHNRLTISLPNETTVESDRLTLGQVAVITGEQELVTKVGEINLGRISVPGQKITIDKSLILSRLACSGLADSDPVISGADSVTVRRLAKVVKGGDFTESTASFLAGSIKDPSIAKWEPQREPADMVLSGQHQNIELLPRLLSRGATGQATVEVVVVADGEALGTRQVVFRPRFKIHRAVTVKDVPAGSALTTENIRIEEVEAGEQEPAGWTPPYGFIAARNLVAGTVIGAGLAKAPIPEVLIERNQTVTIRIDLPGMVVTAMGKAMQQGRAGEYIKVRNVDSQRIIPAKVNEDGTVEPVF